MAGAVNLNANERARFQYGHDALDYFEVYMDSEDNLQIRTPQASVAVRPHSSNVVFVQAVDRT